MHSSIIKAKSLFTHSVIAFTFLLISTNLATKEVSAQAPTCNVQSSPQNLSLSAHWFGIQYGGDQDYSTGTLNSLIINPANTGASGETMTVWVSRSDCGDCWVQLGTATYTNFPISINNIPMSEFEIKATDVFSSHVSNPNSGAPINYNVALRSSQRSGDVCRSNNIPLFRVGDFLPDRVCDNINFEISETDTGEYPIEVGKNFTYNINFNPISVSDYNGLNFELGGTGFSSTNFNIPNGGILTGQMSAPSQPGTYNLNISYTRLLDRKLICSQPITVVFERNEQNEEEDFISIDGDGTDSGSTSGFYACDQIPDANTEQISACEGCLGDRNNQTGKVWTAFGCFGVANQNEFVKSLITLAVGTAGGIALLLILFGAFNISTSASNPEQLKLGQEVITAAVTGLIFIILSVAILQFIGVTIFQIPGL